MLLYNTLPPKTNSDESRQEPKYDLHGLDENGMVICNPRDKEAALRAQTENIATENWEAVTCRKCLAIIYKRNKGMRKAND